MSRSFKILHIEDIPSDVELVDRILKKSGILFEKFVVGTKKEYIQALEKFSPDIILSDHSLPAFNSLEALKILRETGKDTPFILITATVSEEFAVSIMKEGASDYVLKDRLQRLPSAVINAIEKYQLDIDRQNYLNKIVANEALFSRAELIAEFGTWRTDIVGKTINWSAGTYPLLGYKQDEVIPSFESFLNNIYPDDVHQIAAIFQNAAHIDYYGEADFRVKNHDGGIRYIHAQFELETNVKNEPVYIIGFNQDVTPAKLAQLEIQKNIEELKAASARQSAILNALPPNVVLLNQAGKIVAVNESWKKITLANNLGIPKYGIDYSYIAISKSAVGLDDLSAKKIAKGIKEIITGVISEFSIEYSYYFQQKKVWFQVVVAPLSDKSKKGAVVLHVDITERKLAEELMLQSKANLNTIFENTDTAYVLCDAGHKIVSFNSKANELSLEQFNKKLKIGGQVFTYFPKNSIPNVKNVVQKISNNEIVSYETSYKPKTGSAKWYDVKWVGVANESKSNIGFVLAFKNITERKLSDIERDKLTAELVQRNTDLEQFTYIVSNHLRAPVANIISLSNMLNTLDFDTNETAEVKTALVTSINIFDQIIMDINHISQARNEINEKTEAVSLKTLADEIIFSLNNLISQETATITFDFNRVNKIITVKSCMYSIFYHLILNGIKYKRPDIDLELSVSAKKKADKLEILFTDNGKGIDQKNLENIFGLYKRFDTSVEGRGMGLFMVKTHVESLGGKINVQSELGAGTTFKLEFPDMRYSS